MVAPGTYNPATQLLHRICEPLLAPVRRLVPPIGGLDFSSLFVLIGLQALRDTVVGDVAVAAGQIVINVMRRDSVSDRGSAAMPNTSTSAMPIGKVG